MDSFGLFPEFCHSAESGLYDEPEESVKDKKESTPKEKLPEKQDEDPRKAALKQVTEGLKVLKISSPEQLCGLFDEIGFHRPQKTSSPSKTVCIYDLETTGLGKTKDIGIVEIGALIVGYTAQDGWTELASFHRLW